MIAFTTLEGMISGVRRSVESPGRDGELKPYTKAGAQSGRGWQVTGFYASLTAESRLVFEALHYEEPGLCVIRVYRENPLKVLFAKKWSGDMARFELAIGAAAAAFRAALPVAPVPDHDLNDGLGEMPLSAKDRDLILGALQPIPPPCNPDAIEEA